MPEDPVIAHMRCSLRQPPALCLNPCFFIKAIAEAWSKPLSPV